MAELSHQLVDVTNPSKLMSVTVINVRGLNTPEQRLGVVYCGRQCNGWEASEWGNPFVIGQRSPHNHDVVMDREHVIDLYRQSLESKDEAGVLDTQLASLWELTDRGRKPLGCWCKPQPCHCDVLANLLNARFVATSTEKQDSRPGISCERSKHVMPCGCSFKILGPSPFKDDPVPLLDPAVSTPPLCPAVWEMLAKGMTVGLFQIESSLGKTWTKKLKPRSVEHMNALVALLRPGCLDSKDAEGVSMTDRYVRRANGEPTPSIHPAVDPCVESSYHIVAYQEQVMQIAGAVAGFDADKRDKLRKSIGKKDQAALALVGKEFMEGVATAGVIPVELGQRLWDVFKASGRYLFNRCVSGDTILVRPGTGGRVKGKGYTVEHMYRTRNDIRYADDHGHSVLRRKWMRLKNYGSGLSLNDDERVRPNTVLDIQPAGYRETLLVTTECGRSARVTDSHKFPTTDGLLTAGEIRLRVSRGTEVTLFCRGEYEKGNGKTYNWSGVTKEDLNARGSGQVNGAFGESNWGYTNGSWSDMQKSKKMLEKKCTRCQKETGRLELHHKNGDRSKSKVENLEWLCVSCHKKAEYAAGRVRKGEKGYPSVQTRVVSVVSAGPCETYDVTMKAPSHTFEVNDGLLVCNSHSLAYATVGYHTAYAKAHFPVAFYTAWLCHAREKNAHWHEEVSKLVTEAKAFNIEVKRPNFTDLEAHAWTDGVTVHLGLTDVKGVGLKTAAKDIAAMRALERADGTPIASWPWNKILLYIGDAFGTADIKRLIQVGAFPDDVGTPRRRKLAEWDLVSKLHIAELRIIREDAAKQNYPSIDILCGDAASLVAATKVKKPDDRIAMISGKVRLLQYPPSPLVDSPFLIANWEREALGIALTCQRVDGCDTNHVTHSCADVAAGLVGLVQIGVEIKRVSEKITKKGKSQGLPFCFMTVSDGTAELDVAVWAEEYAQYRGFIRENNLVLIRGRKKPEFDSLAVERISQLS